MNVAIGAIRSLPVYYKGGFSEVLLTYERKQDVDRIRS